MNERQAYYKRAPTNYRSAALQQPKANFSKFVTLYCDCNRAAQKTQKNLAAVGRKTMKV